MAANAPRKNPACFLFVIFYIENIQVKGSVANKKTIGVFAVRVNNGFASNSLSAEKFMMF